MKILDLLIYIVLSIILIFVILGIGATVMFIIIKIISICSILALPIIIGIIVGVSCWLEDNYNESLF